MAHAGIRQGMGARRDARRIRLRGRFHRQEHRDRRSRFRLLRAASRTLRQALHPGHLGRHPGRAESEQQQSRHAGQRRDRGRARRHRHARRGARRNRLRRQYQCHRRLPVRRIRSEIPRLGREVFLRCLRCDRSQGRAHHQQQLGLAAERRELQHARQADRCLQAARGGAHAHRAGHLARRGREGVARGRDQQLQLGQHRLRQRQPARLLCLFPSGAGRALDDHHRLRRAGRPGLQQVRDREMVVRDGADRRAVHLVFRHLGGAHRRDLRELQRHLGGRAARVGGARADHGAVSPT